MTSALMDTYLARYRDAAQTHGESSCNGPCPFCGGTTDAWHRSDRFMIWADRSDNLGKVCTENHIPGVWWCRKCGEGGDTVAYLTKAEGMSFAEACAALGVTLEGASPAPRRHEIPRETAPRPAFAGRPSATVSDVWQEHARRLDEEAREALPRHPEALRWLAKKHGITPGLAALYGLGYLEGENGRDVRFRPLSSFGLPEGTRPDGSKKTKLALRRGITIVSREHAGYDLAVYDPSGHDPDRHGGRIGMFRVRRPNSDVKEREGKYWELPGGTRASFMLPPRGSCRVPVWFVVEGELDAILLHATAGGSVGCLAVRSCSNRPDAAAHGELARAAKIVVALDSDDAGRKGTAWWLSTYRAAVDCPMPAGFKDPGEAFEGGFDLRAWMLGAVPRSVSLAPPITGNAPADADADGRLAHGTCPIGVGGDAETVFSFPPDAGPRSFPSAAAAPYGAGDGADPLSPCPEIASSAPGMTAAAAPYDAGDGADNGTEDGAGTPAPAPVPAHAPTPADAARRAEAARLLTPTELSRLALSLPAGTAIADVHPYVLACAVLWRSRDVVFRKYPNGFAWDFGPRAAAMGAFMRFADTSEVFAWLDRHASETITARNFLALR